MISGKAFYELCSWNLCNRYEINYNSDLIKDGDFIFLNLDNFWQFPSLWVRRFTLIQFQLLKEMD